MSNSHEENAVDWVNQTATVDFTDPATPHDRILVVGETKFYVYTGHLCLSSEFFRAMFNSDFKEKNQEEIEIKDVEAEGFHSFLKLLHPHNGKVITKDNFAVLVEYSHRFLARFAFTMCEEFIVANSATLDAVNLLEMAFKYNLTKLKNKVAEHLTALPPSTTCRNCVGYEICCTKCYKYAVKGIALNNDSIIGKQSKRIAKLPLEIQSFILGALMAAINKP